jgi:hypothetical protein
MQTKKGQVYCNKSCRTSFFADKNKLRLLTLCKFNEGVECRRTSCDNCGWHPEVIEKRIDQINKFGAVL